MRGDVKALFERLLALYSNKISLLQTLLLNESEKLVYINAKDVQRLQEAIENDEAVYSDIDGLDFEIGTLKDSICSIMGIETRYLFSILKKSSEPLATELTAANNEIKGLLQEILREHTRLLGDMEKLMGDIKIDQETLMRLIKINSFDKKEP